MSSSPQSEAAFLCAHTANLARLHINSEDEISLAEELSKILAYVQSLANVDTSGSTSEPIYTLKSSCALRPDILDCSDAVAQFRSNFMTNAPQVEGRYIKVPKMTKSV